MVVRTKKFSKKREDKAPKTISKRKFYNLPKKPKETRFPRRDLVSKNNIESGTSESEIDDDSVSDCEEYEKRPRQNQNQVRVRNLLPVKSKKGFQYRSEIEQNEEIEQEEIPKSIKKEKSVESSTNLIRSYASQQKNLCNLKSKVAMLCTSIVEDPENNIMSLKELVTMLDNPASAMIVSEKSILSLSLLHVFSDVLPGYKIRLQEESETKSKLKKDTKKLLHFEQSLLRYYKKYIDCLHSMVQDMKSKKMGRISMTAKKALREIGLVAVKCLCELLATRFTFNYFKNIVNIVVPRIAKRDVEVTNMCCQAFERVFRADKLGDASFDIVKSIVKMTKERKFQVPHDLIKTFTCLNLKEAKLENKKKADMKEVRKKLNSMSRKEKWQQKRTRKLEHELRETEAQECVENVSRFHTSTLNKVFWVYFHVLKDSEKMALISTVLEGLSQFSYLINLEFFDDLNAVLCRLMETGSLNVTEKLHCLHTLFIILAGQAESLNIDPHKIYCHMYQILLNVCSSQETKQFDLVLKCLNRMILKRKSSVTFSGILAFIKRLSTVALHTPLNATLGLLSMIRVLLLNVKGSDILLDSETMIGSGVYLPEIEDPEYCNPQATALWELFFLKKHYNPVIKSYSQHIMYGCPLQGRLSLPETLSKANPELSLTMLTDVFEHHELNGFIDVEEPPKKKFKRTANPDQSCFDAPLEVSWETVKAVDFVSCFNVREDLEIPE